MIRIVIVDDQSYVRRGLRLCLALQENVEIVGEAADGSSALALAAALEPDIVLMDVTMPGMDGIETAQVLHRILPETAVIILTMHGDAVTRERALAAGAAQFVEKNQGINALLAAIRQSAPNS